MGKKNPITGNISLTPQECDTLKSYAVNSITVKADNGRLQERLASAQKSAAIWKKRYESLNEKYQELKKSVQPYLEPDQATVGSALRLEHKSPTPLGMNAWAQSRLVEVDGRRLVFEIEAFDQAGPIAVARHERFIVKTPSFMTTFLALSVILYFPANPVYTGTIRCRSRTVLPLERHG